MTHRITLYAILVKIHENLSYAVNYLYCMNQQK